jgi:hypothetical protein
MVQYLITETIKINQVTVDHIDQNNRVYLVTTKPEARLFSGAISANR